jgi:hypothetical protein
VQPFLPPLYAEPTQVTEILNRQFRVFGAGPWPYHTADARPSTDLGSEARGAGRRTAHNARANMSPEGRFIDWQLDVLSGHRWSADRVSTTLTVSTPPGADIKVPWEIGRCHAVSLLALAWNEQAPSAISRAMEHIVLDFISTNPPGHGVHWVSGLEVSIRAMNWLVAVELLVAKGYPFDSAWTAVVHEALVEHGRFIHRHLSWVPKGRNNHYLGEVVGLLALGACLPPSAQTDAWLAYGFQELERELLYQILPDGGSFEGSSAYHGFACEFALLGTALCLATHGSGRSPSYAPFRPPGARRLRPTTIRRWRDAPLGSSELFVAPYWVRLEKAARFLQTIEMHDGQIPQIGDNDSGRLLKFGVPTAGGSELCGLQEGDERLLDYRAVASALRTVASPARKPRAVQNGPGRRQREARRASARALGPRGECAQHAKALEALTVWADTPTVPVFTAAPAAPPMDRLVLSEEAEWITPGREYRYVFHASVDLEEGLEVSRFPDFGLVVYRSRHLFLSVRCPLARSRHPRAGHVHADELSIELAIDASPVVRDPGTGCYTSDHAARNAFRGRAKHFTPLPDVVVPPGRAGLFVGPAPARIEVDETTTHRFRATARAPQGTFSRSVSISGRSVVVIDLGTSPWEPKPAASWRSAYSPRYGSVVTCF